MLHAFGDARVGMKAFRLLHMVARRGNSRDFPENSLPALRSALALGARFIEFDVHVASDGIPVVAHDREFAQVARFENLTAAQLAAFPEGRITSLETALTLFERRPEITPFVVIGETCVRRFGREHVISKLSRALLPVRSRCVLVSSDLATAHTARHMTGFPVGWILPSYDDHARLKYEALQPDYLFCKHAHIPAGSTLWRGPWRWLVYEVDSLQTALDFASRGAHFVATRDVRALGEAMRAHAAAGAPAKNHTATRS